MKIVVAPDKFKGSLPAAQVAAAITAGLRAVCPGADLVTIPVGRAGQMIARDRLAEAVTGG